MRKIFLFLLVLILASGCTEEAEENNLSIESVPKQELELWRPSLRNLDPTMTYMIQELVQCEAYPWDEWWLKKHSSKTYEDPPERNELISTYFKENDYRVYDVQFVRFNEKTCSSCGCSTGFAVFILVDKEKIQEFEELRFRKI